MTEEWRPVPGYEGRYEVSDQGRVRSLVGPTPRVLRASRHTNGYRAAPLGRGVTKSVHRLVLTAFVGPCPEGRQAAHENGDRADNRLVNLSWKTPAENSADKRRHGTLVTGDRHYAHLRPDLILRGERIGRALLTEADVREIRAATAAGETQTSLATRYGVSRPTIADIAHRRTWRHVHDALCLIDPVREPAGAEEVERIRGACRAAIRAATVGHYASEEAR